MAETCGTCPPPGSTSPCVEDAHLLNLGAFADPDRRLLFDLNDFDETCTGPFEWDLKRLAASFQVAGESLGLPRASADEAVLALVAGWREALQAYALVA